MSALGWEGYFVYGLIALAVLGFASGRFRLDLIAGGVMIALAVSGILKPAQIVAEFGNPLVILIAGLFVISEGLSRTGVASAVGQAIARLSGNSETRLLLLLMPVVAGLSGVMSSTGVVALFIPVVLTLAREAGLAASRLLMPVSIASLIGGMLTLIGTPPNLVVNQALIAQGLPGFGFFEFAEIGLPLLIFALLYLLWLQRRQSGPGQQQGSPAARSMFALAERYQMGDSLRRIQIRQGSPLAGQTVGEAALRREHGLTVIGVERHGHLLTTLQPVLVETRLQERDVLFVVATRAALERASPPLALVDIGFPNHLQRRFRENFGISETLVVPESPLIGKTVLEAGFRARQKINVLGLRRGQHTEPLDFRETRLQSGDVLLVAGAWSDLDRLTGPRPDLILLQMPSESDDRIWYADRAPMAIGITVAMLVAMVFGLVGNLLAVMLAAFAMLVTRCVKAEEAYRSMNWQSLMLIAGMLPLAEALQVSGGAGLLVGLLTEGFSGLGPMALLFGLFILTSLLSQFISNTATTVLLAPIALGLAQDLGYPPEALLMTVAIAASTAFATPVASPVNILVMAPGGYRFMDFVRVGVPLQVIACVFTVLWLNPG